ncbi:hypothetical protein QDY63_14605 [Pseudomonas brenneri]|uniref:hypothetical protein n=1 Tax=Pseudomonas brenneri TaxID=129817 RepID=UPI0025A080DF|nr:hypothetical protein [Pseudomonas brenneri]WJM94044.1 hypothetical protein QDY63_14605 [Pseudomonas brenneri]
MKMRDELELYRTKTIQPEDELRAANSAHETTLKDWQQTQEQELHDLTSSSEKKLKDKDDQYQRRQADVTRLQEQINNLQDILDVIPGVMPRKKEDNYTENACHVRLASVLAVKFM